MRDEQVAALVKAGCSAEKLAELDDGCVEIAHAELKRRGENAAARKVNAQHADLVKKRSRAPAKAYPSYRQRD